MNASDHRLKAERIGRSLARCTRDDYETIIEGAMLAGTQWFNILLHRMDLMPAETDAIHAEFLPLAQRRKLRVLLPRALDAIDTIEGFRTTHVRGDMPDGQRAGMRALECLAELKAQALPE